MKQIVIVLISLMFINFAFWSCDDEPGTYLTLNVVEKTLSPRDTFAFVLKVQGFEPAAGETIAWSLLNSEPTVAGTEVASISPKGLLTANALGSVTVKASIGGRYALAHVDVVERSPAPEGDMSFGVSDHYMGIIGLLPDTLELTVKATVLELYELKLSSGNNDIVRAELLPDTAASTGDIYLTRKVLLQRGGTEGTATVSVNAGGTSVSVNVHVGVKAFLSFDRIVTGLGGTPSLVTLNPYTFYIGARDTILIYYVAEPDDPEHLAQLRMQVASKGDGVLAVKEIKRNSGYYSIVVESGQLKGNQQLTFTLDGNKLIADCTVMDRNDVTVNSVTVQAAYKNITTTLRGLALGESVKVVPLAALVHWPVVWKSSNTSIATVNASGDVSIHKPGTVILTAISKDKTDQLTIKAQLALEAISFNPGLTTTLAESETTTWTANLTANYTTETVTRSWKSSNPAVATVDNKGNITALNEGSTEISVSATDDLGTTKEARQLLTVTAVNIGSLNFDVTPHQYYADVAVDGPLNGISIDVFTPDFSNNYQFRLYKAHEGVSFDLSGTTTYTVGTDIHLESNLVYLDNNESATLLAGSKLIINKGTITFDMSARRGTKTFTVKGTVTKHQ